MLIACLLIDRNYVFAAWFMEFLRSFFFVAFANLKNLSIIVCFSNTHNMGNVVVQCFSNSSPWHLTVILFWRTIRA